MSKHWVNYKGILIESNSNNNFCFIGKRVFKSSLSAKRWITKVTNFCYRNNINYNEMFFKLLVK